MNERIAKLIRFLKEYIPKGYDAYCVYGSDPAAFIYDEDGLRVYQNAYYAYIDIIGLTSAEKVMIKKSGWLDCCWE